MYYIGIDPSLLATAIVTLRDIGDLHSSKVISSKYKGVKRLRDLRDQIHTHLCSFSSGIVLPVFIENYSYGSRIGQAFSIGEWGGVLRVLLDELGHVVTEVAPTTLKKFVAGKGNVKKDIMIKEVFRKWEFDVSDDNEADAFGLAKICWSASNQKNLTKTELEVIKTVMKKKEVIS